MDNNSGIIYDKYIQTKMLILFILSRVSRPIALETLIELMSSDERIGYFDVTDCVSKLVEQKLVHFDDGLYAMTAKGSRSSKILEVDIPYSVRVKAQEAVSRINEVFQRDSLIKTYRNADEKGGFSVALTLSDGVGDILSVDLYAANEQQAAALEDGFRRKAESLYHKIIELICE